MLQLFLCPLIGFLLGSIPFGLLIARSQGIDIRANGSGNIGATNVLRVVGKKFGITCLILDFLKGLIPVLIATNLVRIYGRPVQIPLGLPAEWVVMSRDAFTPQLVHIATALAAVLGHNFSPWVGFRGGKGIATSGGVLLGVMPPVAVLLLIVIWLMTFLTSRFVSLASIVTASSLPFLVLYGSWSHGRLQDGTWNVPLFVFSILIAGMAIVRHRSNIARLRAGTEPKFERKTRIANV